MVDKAPLGCQTNINGQQTLSQQLKEDDDDDEMRRFETVLTTTIQHKENDFQQLLDKHSFQKFLRIRPGSQNLLTIAEKLRFLDH